MSKKEVGVPRIGGNKNSFLLENFYLDVILFMRSLIYRNSKFVAILKGKVLIITCT